MTAPKSDIQISVVIPAYNAGRCIARAIDSVLAQTRPAEEIIVVDDGSTDNTAAIVREYGDRIRLFQQPNAGECAARNTGIDAAVGNWIAFLDADDQWLPEKLQLQTDHLRRNPDLYWTAANFWKKPEDSTPPKEYLSYEKGLELLGGKSFFDDYFAAYTHGATGCSDTKLIRKDVFSRAGLFNVGQRRAGDIDMWFRIGYLFPKIGYLPQPLAIYYIDTPDSASKLYDDVGFMVDLIERHRALSESHHRDDAFRSCIVSMLQTWMRRLVKQKRKQDALTLLNRYGSFLPGRFRREMVFRLYVPWLGSLIADTLDNLKKRWRQRRCL